MFIMKIWSGKEIQFTQGLLEHALGQISGYVSQINKIGTGPKIKRYLTSTVNFFDVTIDMLTRIFQTTDC